MNLNIAEVKAALKEAGHVVSEGTQWLQKDITALEQYAHFVWGIAKEKLHYGLAYPATLPADFPGQATTADAAATTK